MSGKPQTCWRCMALVAKDDPANPQSCPYGYETHFDSVRGYMAPSKRCIKPKTLAEVNLFFIKTGCI